MGFIGGLLGAWFNQLNKHLTVHRILHVNSRAKIVRLVNIIGVIKNLFDDGAVEVW